MELFLLRHGKAFDRSSQWRPDSLRPLTPAGEREMFKVARGIKSLEKHFDLILTSPFARAHRTAEILTEVLKTKAPTLCPELSADAAPGDFLKKFQKQLSSQNKVLLTGHEPYLSSLASILLTGNKKLSLHFRKGGLCKLTLEHLGLDSKAALEWLLTPTQLTELR